MSNICICGHFWKDHLEGGDLCFKEDERGRPCDCLEYIRAEEVAKSSSVSRSYVESMEDPYMFYVGVWGGLVVDLLRMGVREESMRLSTLNLGLGDGQVIFEARGLRVEDEKAQ